MMNALEMAIKRRAALAAEIEELDEFLQVCQSLRAHDGDLSDGREQPVAAPDDTLVCESALSGMRRKKSATVPQGSAATNPAALAREYDAIAVNG